MSLIDDIRILAIQAVTDEESDPEYKLRKIFRFYSSKFHTPLHKVQDLPLEEVLQAYFETIYETMESADIDEEIKLLLETPEQKQARINKEAADQLADEEFLKQIKEENETKNTKEVPKTIDDIAKISRVNEQMASPETTLPEGTTLPPDINFKFVNADELEEEIARLDGMGDKDNS